MLFLLILIANDGISGYFGPALNGTLPDKELAVFEDITILWITFQDALVGSVPQTLFGGGGAHFERLTDLIIQDNAFTGTIPEVGPGIPNLQLLQLNGADVTGTIPWPSIITHLSSTLVKLRLGSLEYITGTLPSDIGEMTTLENLVLVNTPITGTLPPSIGLMQNMQVSEERTSGQKGIRDVPFM